MTRLHVAALALATAGAALSLPAPAGAQPDGRPGGGPEIGPNGVPIYQRWQHGWDRGDVDRRHVILGTVTGFAPYRLTIARTNGDVDTLDLKNGTVIAPHGATPTTNERVAVVGYYSKGTFIANRVVIHP